VIVLDASAVVELLLHTASGRWVAGRIAAEESLHAPHLLSAEVTQVLRRWAALGALPAPDARDALSDLAGLDIEHYPHEPFLDRVWQLRHNLTAYDALYVTLAEVLAAPLLTADRRIATASGHSAAVELMPEP
jgi:predicted nucleic acid-binding protein